MTREGKEGVYGVCVCARQEKTTREGKEGVYGVCVCTHVAPLHARGVLVEINNSLLAGINRIEYWADHKLQES